MSWEWRGGAVQELRCREEEEGTSDDWRLSLKAVRVSDPRPFWNEPSTPMGHGPQRVLHFSPCPYPPPHRLMLTCMSSITHHSVYGHSLERRSAAHSLPSYYDCTHSSCSLSIKRECGLHCPVRQCTSMRPIHACLPSTRRAMAPSDPAV